MRVGRSIFFVMFGLAFVGWSIQAVHEQRRSGFPWKTGAGAAILLTAAVGAWLSFRSNKEAPSPVRPVNLPVSEDLTPAQEPSVGRLADRVLESGNCAVCGRQLGIGERFCAFDGAEGVSEAPSHRPAICPSCGRGYVDGRADCAEDGTELVPVTGRSRPSAGANRSPKVCPTCGKRRARGSYCPHDGDRLVALN